MIELVVGLGNKGPKYRKTRHNIGFMVLDRVARRLSATEKAGAVSGGWWGWFWNRLGLAGPSGRELYRLSETDSDGRPLLLAWPRTFMNRSGLAVRDLLEQYSFKPDQVLIVVDDFQLPLGRIRLRKGGSDGGHNGLMSIIETIGAENFPRLRVGTGPVPDNTSTVDYVLGEFDASMHERVEEVLDISSEAVLFCLSHSLEEAMNRFN